MSKRIFSALLVAVSLVLAATGCSTEGGKTSMGPGTHKLNSADAGVWKAPGSRTCRWTYEYKTRHNGPVKKLSGKGRHPSITIGSFGVRFTSDNCGTFKK